MLEAVVEDEDLGPGRERQVPQAPVERARTVPPLNEVGERAGTGDGVGLAVRAVDRGLADGLEPDVVRDAEPGEGCGGVLLRRPVLQHLELAVEPAADVGGLLEHDGAEAHPGEVERGGQPGRSGPDNVDGGERHVSARS